MKNILITGISGQDGIFLTSKLLSSQKLNIYGVSRSSKNLCLKKINSINKLSTNNLNIINVDLNNKEAVLKFINDVNPNIIFNLSGPSSVYDSFTDNEISKNTIVNIFNNLVEASLTLKKFPKFFQASSSEMYGLNQNEILNEEDTFLPNSPYAEAKLTIHKLIKDNYTQKGIEIKSGIMFNHESEFRNENYLFMKIINYALNAKASNKKLEIGSFEIVRDWSFAGDIADGILNLTLEGKDIDYCIGSGEGNSIKELVNIVFNYFNLDYQDYVQENPKILRKNDPIKRISDPSKLKKELNWSPKLNFEELVERCISRKFS